MAARDPREGGETLPALLKRVINETSGLTQSRLAERSGVPLATLNAWTTGRRSPKNNAEAKGQLRALAPHLPGVSVRDLFEAVGQQVPGEVSPDEESRLWELYRNLSAGRQQVVAQLVETLAAEQKVD